MDSILALGTLKNSRFFFRSDLKDVYCPSTTHLVLITYRLVMSDMRLNSINQITPDLVFVGILNVMSSGLSFHSRSGVIFRVEPIPFFSFFPMGSEDTSSPFLFPCSTVFDPYNDQRLTNHQQKKLKNEHTHHVCVTDFIMTCQNKRHPSVGVK